MNLTGSKNNAGLLPGCSRSRSLCRPASPARRARPALPVETGATLPILPAQSQTTPLASLMLAAQFAGDRKPIRSGLVWRILSETADGSPPRIVARSSDAEPVFSLEPGTYLLHAAYGFASGTKRVTVGPQGLRDQISISAGGLSLAGSIGDAPIAPAQLSFQVFVPLQGNSEGRLVANARGGELIRLPEGTYHIVSTYGDSNAIQRADVKVESGKVTDATLHHRAARVTLKLVAAPGGEAFAGTAFSVLTPGRRRHPRGDRRLSAGDPGGGRLCPDRPAGGAGTFAGFQGGIRLGP